MTEIRAQRAKTSSSLLFDPIWILFCIALLLRILWASVANPYEQHDPHKHLPALFSVLQLQSPVIDAGPYYYAIVAIASLPLVGLLKLGLLNEKQFLTLATAWSGALLQGVFMYGCLLLARRLRFRADAQFVFVALCTFFPPLQRSFGMLRPENLIAAGSPYVCALFVSLWRGTSISCSGAGLIVVMAAQKISGLFLVAGLTASTVVFRPKLIIWRRSALLICAALVALFVGQRVATGYWFFETEWFADPHYYQTTPTIDLFLRFNPLAAWQRPFRNAHKDSMLNILLIDMFGDYWRYGIDHSSVPNHPKWRLFRARLGIVSAIAFVCFYFSGLFALARQPAPYLKERRLLSAIFFVGPAMLVLATLNGYAAEKFDIIKWEYILPFVPLLMIPSAHLLDTSLYWQKRWLVTGVGSVIISAGVFQSIHLYNRNLWDVPIPLPW